MVGQWLQPRYWHDHDTYIITVSWIFLKPVLLIVQPYRHLQIYWLIFADIPNVCVNSYWRDSENILFSRFFFFKERKKYVTSVPDICARRKCYRYPIWRVSRHILTVTLANREIFSCSSDWGRTDFYYIISNHGLTEVLAIDTTFNPS
jgi:hypothetical protein